MTNFRQEVEGDICKTQQFFQTIFFIYNNFSVNFSIIIIFCNIHNKRYIYYVLIVGECFSIDLAKNKSAELHLGFQYYVSAALKVRIKMSKTIFFDKQ